MSLEMTVVILSSSVSLSDDEETVKARRSFFSTRSEFVIFVNFFFLSLSPVVCFSYLLGEGGRREKVETLFSSLSFSLGREKERENDWSCEGERGFKEEREMRRRQRSVRYSPR